MASRRSSSSAPREHEADAVRLLLYAHRRRGDVAALAHARLTLESMAEGAIFDAADGGFFRVSDPPGWDAPRPEKRACDQGALLLAIGELALVDAARTAIAARDPVRALGALAQRAREYGAYGNFAPEARYLQLEAYRLAGDRSGAREAAGAILRHDPGGPHVDTARSELERFSP